MTRSRPACLCAAVVLLAPLWGTAACAADAGSTSALKATSDAASDDWIVTIGGSIATAPNYAGSSRYGPTFMPSFGLRKADEPNPFSAPDDNFGITLLEFGGIELGPLAAIRGSRSGSAVPGLPGYSWSLETGMFAEFWPIDGLIRTRVEALYGLRSNDGLTVNLAADAVTKTGPFTWALGPRLTILDNTVMQTEFGVAPTSTLVNPLLTPFNAHGGVKSAGAAGSVSYDWSKDWTVSMFANYDRLVGDAAASPVTRQFGTANQFTVGMGLEYSFVWKP